MRRRLAAPSVAPTGACDAIGSVTRSFGAPLAEGVEPRARQLARLELRREARGLPPSDSRGRPVGADLRARHDDREEPDRAERTRQGRLEREGGGDGGREGEPEALDAASGN